MAQPWGQQGSFLVCMGYFHVCNFFGGFVGWLVFVLFFFPIEVMVPEPCQDTYSGCLPANGAVRLVQST